MKKASLKDIAAMTGTSITTVSLVLNGRAKQMRISDEVAELIVKTADEAGYVPNQMAVRLRTGKSKLIGIIVDTISGNFFSTLAPVVEQSLAPYGYRIIYAATENEPERTRQVIQMLREQAVEGYILMPHNGMRKELDRLLQDEKPVVLLDMNFEDLELPVVRVDGEQSIIRLVHQLVQKGYQRIGIVTSDHPHAQLQYRLSGYEQGLIELGMPLKRAYIHTVAMKKSREAQLKALNTWLQQKNRPDCVIFSANYLGVLGVEVLQRLGWNMPNDLGMVVFDDQDLFRLYPGGISVIEQPTAQMAESAANLLLQGLGIKKGGRKLEYILPGKTILRGST